MTESCNVRITIGYSSAGSNVTDKIRVNGIEIWSKNEPISYHNTVLPLMSLKKGDVIGFEHGSGTCACTIYKLNYS